MAITTYYNNGIDNATPQAFLIICPFEGTFSDTATSTADNFEIIIESWKWPDYYGFNAPIGAHLRYLWTEKSGYLTAYLTETKSSSDIPNCILGDAESVFPLYTSTYKASITITLLSSLGLKPKTDNNKDKEKMFINLNLNDATVNSLPTMDCSSGLENVNC